MAPVNTQVLINNSVIRKMCKCTCIVLDSDLHMLVFSIGRALSKLTRSSSYISEVLICYTDKTLHLKTFDPLL